MPRIVIPNTTKIERKYLYVFQKHSHRGPPQEGCSETFSVKTIFLIRCNPVDTGRKLNVHKTFRRRPGRLLNVLCTFNLRLVSTGKRVKPQSFFLNYVANL